MSISVKSNFDLRLGGREFEGGDMTLSDLLKELGSEQHANVDFLDPHSNEVDDSFIVCINGREYRYLPKRLATPLHSGDEVRITVLPLGGG